MSARIQRFHRNARTWDILKTWAFLPLILALAAWFLEHKDYMAFAAALVICVFAPYLVRDALVRRLKAFLAVTDLVPILVLVTLALAEDVLSDHPTWVVVLLCLLGAYVGAFFWVLSDPRVVAVRRGGRVLLTTMDDSM